MKLNYCPVCGKALQLRHHPTEPPTAWCASCEDWRFPLFSCAVSGILLDKSASRMLLIRQYGEPDPVLVAGYVDKGETAEEALLREVREELGMTALSPRFLGSHYYAPSETLMLNFMAVLAEDEAHPGPEVDSWEWANIEDAARLVKPDGLARILLADWDGHFDC